LDKLIVRDEKELKVPNIIRQSGGTESKSYVLCLFKTTCAHIKRKSWYE